MILQNTQDVLADRLMTACQAIDIRRRLNTHGQVLVMGPGLVLTFSNT